MLNTATDLSRAAHSWITQQDDRTGFGTADGNDDLGKSKNLCEETALKDTVSVFGEHVALISDMLQSQLT